MIKIRVAIISDIHGNNVALEAILKDSKQRNIDEYVYTGDLINELPFGNETLELVRSTSNKVLKGNKEQYLIEYEQEKYNWKNIQFKNTIFMYDELTEKNREYIRNLPYCMNWEFDGVKLCIAHASPTSLEEQLKFNENDLINKHVQNLDADGLIFGHIHERIWYKYIDNKLVLNAGCAGIAPYHIGKAEYVILTLEAGKILKIEPQLVDYDIKEVKRKIIKSGILNYDKVFMNLTYCAINGNGRARHNFFEEAKETMLKKKGVLHQKDAKGIYTYFKLYDDDIWLNLGGKYKEYFEI